MSLWLSPAYPKPAASAVPLAPAFKNSKFLPLHGKKPRIAARAGFPRSLALVDSSRQANHEHNRKLCLHPPAFCP